jgi:hypothetical protein
MNVRQFAVSEKNVIQRQRGDNGFLAFLQYALDPGRSLLHVGHHVPVGQHRALGHTGGAAGVLQEGDVIVIGGHGFEAMLCTQLQCLLERNGVGQFIARDHFLDVFDDEIDDRRLRERQHVPHAGNDDVLDGRLGDDLFEHVAKIFHDDDRFRTRVVHLVPELSRGIQRVGIDHDHACAQDAEDSHRVLQQVGHHDRNFSAFLQAQFVGQVCA